MVHGKGIEPPISPNTFRDRPEMSILSGFPGNSQISDCPGWFWMLSLSLSHGRGLETPKLEKLRCRVPRQERNTSLHFDGHTGQEGRPGFGKSNPTDPVVLGDPPNVRRLHYRSTV